MGCLSGIRSLCWQSGEETWDTVKRKLTPLVSALQCKELGSITPILSKKKTTGQTKKQWLFLDPSENWGHNCCPENWRERWIQRVSLPRAEAQEEKPVVEPVGRNLHWNWPAAGGRVWTSLRVQNPQGTIVLELYLQEPHHVLAVNLEENPLRLSSRSWKSNHCEVCQNTQFFLQFSETKASTQGGLLTGEGQLANSRALKPASYIHGVRSGVLRSPCDGHIPDAQAQKETETTS